ncbi:zinc finger 236-like [Argonauta hians]
MTLDNLMVVESESKNQTGTDSSRNVTFESSNSANDACLQDNSSKSSCENNASICRLEASSSDSLSRLELVGAHSLATDSLSENFKHDVRIYETAQNAIIELLQKTKKADDDGGVFENVTNATRVAVSGIQGFSDFDEIDADDEEDDASSELENTQRTLAGLVELSGNLYEISNFPQNPSKEDFTETNCIENNVSGEIGTIDGGHAYITDSVGNLEIYGGKSEILGNSIVDCESSSSQAGQENYVDSMTENDATVNIIATLDTEESNEINTRINHILEGSGSTEPNNIDNCEKGLCDSAAGFENKICDSGGLENSSGVESLSEGVGIGVREHSAPRSEQQGDICSRVNSKGNICESVLPMDNICGADVAMNDLCEADLPMTDMCEPEIAIGDVCTAEIPMADVSDIAMQDICESDIQMNAICDSDISINNICASDIQIGTVCGPEITMSNICGTDIGMNNVCVADISMSNICVANSPSNNICVSDSPGTHINFAGTSICASDSPGNICVTDSLTNNICTQEVLANNICATDALGNTICTAITLENNICATDISNLCVASVAKNAGQEGLTSTDSVVTSTSQANAQSSLVDVSMIKTEPVNSNTYGVCLAQKQANDQISSTPATETPKKKRPSRPKNSVPETCTVCNRVFTNSTSLKKHMKTHSGEKPFECDVCKKCFQEPSNLKRHKIIHSGERPFKCKVCEKAFSQSYTLTRHMRTHKPKTELVETVNALSGAIVTNSDTAVALTENGAEDVKPLTNTSCVTALPAISNHVTALPAISTCMTALPSISTCITALPTISTCMTALPTIGTVLPTIGTVLPTINTTSTTVLPVNNNTLLQGNNTCLAVITNNGETVSSVGNLCTAGLVNTILAAASSSDNLGNGLCAAEGPTVEIESSMCSPTELAVAVCGTDISKNSLCESTTVSSKESESFDLDTLRENVGSASAGAVADGNQVSADGLEEGENKLVVCKVEPVDAPNDMFQTTDGVAEAVVIKMENGVNGGGGSSNEAINGQQTGTTATTTTTKKKKKSSSNGGSSSRSKSVVSEACTVCQRVFTNLTTLKKHLKTHTGERPFECEVCHKCFQEPSHLTRHKRIHSGEKPFKCKVCEKAFSQSYTLTRHMRTHSGERPFKCEVCSKAFSQSYTLTVHRRTHSTDRPYECEICHSKFFEASHLTRHFRTHIGEQHFTCELCHKHF